MSSSIIQVFAERIDHPRWQQVETELINTLSPSMRESVECINHPLQKKRSVVARLLLIEVLAKHYRRSHLSEHWNLAANSKPEIDGFPFNFSHAGNWVFLAINEECPVGIDVERRRNIEPTKFKKHFSPGELEWIQRHPKPDLAFIEWWTKKEAVVKAIGVGLRMPLRDLIEHSPRNDEVEGVLYTAIQLPHPEPDYRAHLAVAAENPTVQVNYVSR